MLALSLLASACVIVPGRIDIGGLLGGLAGAPPWLVQPLGSVGPLLGAQTASQPGLTDAAAALGSGPAAPESAATGPGSAGATAESPATGTGSARVAAESPATAAQVANGAPASSSGAMGVLESRTGDNTGEALTANAAPAAVELPLAPTAPANEPLLPRKRIVAYYGNPLATGMGVLGEQPLPQTVQRLRQQAKVYADADPTRPVQLALELITPVAQGAPGADGLYRLRMAPEVIDEVAELAEREHLLLILDVQIGQSTVPDELQVLLPYLERPYVHLALDPEFAIADKHGEPGEVIGTLDASDVNYAIGVLTNLVTAHHLPPKVLVVHRFLEKMLTNYEAVQPTPSVQVVIDMDGFGTPYVKGAKYVSFVHDQAVQYGGVKLFYKHDKPLLTPADVLELQPAPDLVIYQ